MKIAITSAIMCEFLTSSQNNKHVLVNVIAGDLYAKEFPTSIPTAFYFEITPKDSQSGEFNIEIFVGRKLAASAVAEINFEKGKTAALALPAGIMKIQKPCEIRLFLVDKNGQRTNLIKKRILEAPTSPIS